MTSSHRFTSRPSPGQIRRAGEQAFRNRVLAAIPEQVPELRAPDEGETPLSAHEVAWAVAHGHVRTAREGAFTGSRA